MNAVLLTLLLTACGPDPAPEAEIPSWAKVAPEQIAEAAKHGVPVAFENDLGMRVVLIPAGTFLMGSPEGEEGRDDDETQHEVTISRPFYMSITEVTNQQFRAWKRDHDSGESQGLSLNADSQPVVMLSWEDATAYTRWLDERDAQHAYRLPTEAEWERACRAGAQGRFWWGSSEEEAGKNANVADLAAMRAWRWWSRLPTFRTDDGYAAAAPVATYHPNAWGLFDMLGNVSEWCSDWYGEYEDKPAVDPQGPPPPRACHAIRGGSCYVLPQRFVRTAARAPRLPDWQTEKIGFRLVSPLPEPGER